MIGSVVAHRDLIRDFVVKDMRGRFAGSTLGMFWSVVQPLVMIGIFVVVFSRIMGAKLGARVSPGVEYSVYLCAGLFPWAMFAEHFYRSTNIFLENANLIKKVAFPKEILNVSVAITSLINFLISFTLFILFLAFLQLLTPYRSALALPHLLIFYGVIMLQQLFGFGLGLIFSALNVFFRDIAQFVNVITQLWFWFTPIVYREELLPAGFAPLLRLNPMYYFIKIYHSIFVDQHYPTVRYVVAAGVIAVVTCAAGYLVFRALSDEIPDEI
jgi:lipopolysaccharide transport system permease protein